MTEIEHRYLKDNNDNIFYPLTHIDAVQGLDADSFSQSDEIDKKIKQKTDEINSTINDVNKTIENANKTITEQQKIIDENKTKIDRNKTDIGENKTDITNMSSNFENIVGITGWVPYGYNVGQGVEADAIHGGKHLICGLKEVRVGIPNVTRVARIKTISYNLRNFENGQQVAQLPSGFLKDNLIFTAHGHGNRGSYRVEVLTNGKMTVYVNPNDRDLDRSYFWIYGQFTWVE